MNKTVLITGTSSGFGRLAAKKFQQEGWNVIATMRSPEKETEFNAFPNVLLTRLDVTDKDSIKNAIEKGIEKFGKIDVLVNNAGFGTFGPLELATDTQIRSQMDVNYFGLIDVTKGILPHFRANKEGLIINISSVGGRTTFPYVSIYHATKYAVEGLTESLQYELNPMGIQLKLVEPGAFNTDFATRSMGWVQVPEGSDYKERLDAFTQWMAEQMAAGQDPQEVADTIFGAATDGADRLRYLVGADAIQTIEARKQMDDDTAFKNMITNQMNL